MPGKNAHRKLPWGDVPFFLALARKKSFSAAAEDLRVDRTTAARRLDKLEASFGIKLFERHSGQLELTQDGRRIMASVERAEQELGQLNADLDNHHKAYGRVRISLSEHVLVGFADQLNQFIQEHPEVFVELITSDRFVDLHKYEADIVLRIAKAPPEKLKNIDLGAVTFGVYQRADQEGKVSSFWAMPGQSELTRQMAKINTQAVVKAAIDGVLPTREMVLAGGGAGVLPKFLGENDQGLVLAATAEQRSSYRMTISCLPEQRNLHRIRIVMKELSMLIRQALSDLDPLPIY